MKKAVRRMLGGSTMANRAVGCEVMRWHMAKPKPSEKNASRVLKGWGRVRESGV